MSSSSFRRICNADRVGHCSNGIRRHKATHPRATQSTHAPVCRQYHDSKRPISRQQKTKGFLIEAEKTLAKKTWFASSTEQKHEEAAELYEKAANAFKVGGCHAQAGDAYSKAAEIHRDQLKQLGEASKCLSSAVKLFKW